MERSITTPKGRQNVAQVAFLLAVVLFTGCRSHRNISTPAPVPPVAETEQPATPVAPEGPQTMQASFNCTVMGMSATGQVRLRQDSIIWVSVSKLMELGRLKVTQDSVVGHLRLSNEYLRMDMNEARRRLGVDYDSLQRLLLQHDFDTPLQLTHPRLSSPITVHFTRRQEDLPLTYPLTIPRNATPFKL